MKYLCTRDVMRAKFYSLASSFWCCMSDIHLIFDYIVRSLQLQQYNKDDNDIDNDNDNDDDEIEANTYI